jgi:hypothetical protein
MKTMIFWDWLDIGICLQVYKQTDFADKWVGVNIQILWLTIYVQILDKKNTKILNVIFLIGAILILMASIWASIKLFKIGVFWGMIS